MPSASQRSSKKLIEKIHLNFRFLLVNLAKKSQNLLRPMRNKTFYIACIITLSTLISCGRRENYRTLQGGVWNTTYNICYDSKTDLRDSVIAIFREIENSLSPFNDSSLISRINRGDDFKTDSLLRRIFNASLIVNRQSKGAFDPTVAPLVNLWGFGYRNSGAEPTKAAIDSVLPFVGINDCRIDSSGTILKKSTGTEFNFSAITKGYGCDLIGEMLLRNGCHDYLVEIGGEIALNGHNPRGEKWHIMIDSPIDNDTAVIHQKMAVIEVTDGGLATSGNYRNFKTTSSGRIWHTINPTDGHPAHTDILSVTIIAPNTMLADAYATACMAMTEENALSMIESIENIEALFITLNPVDSSFCIRQSSGFPKISDR